MKCVICNTSTILADQDYRQVRGWERIQRPAGGTNAIRVPDRTSQQYACRWCVEKLSKGVSPSQETMC